MLFEIKNYYDSHLHWLGSAEILLNKNINTKCDAVELLRLSKEQTMNSNGWIYSYGWDDSDEKIKSMLSIEELDRLFPQVPLLLSHKSGHQSWVNTKALQILKINAGLENILFEKNHFKAYKFATQKKINELKQTLQLGARYFNSLGLTHIRDMTSDLRQFEAALALEVDRELSLAVETFFDIQSIEELSGVIQDLSWAQKQGSRLIRPLGVKFFLDGDISRQTAAFSVQKYDNNLFWSDPEIEQIFIESWKNKQQVSVHAIGDKAVEKVVDIARTISASGIGGRLNIEHAEVISNQTLLKMKALHVQCHFQPLHYFLDQEFLYKNYESQQVFAWGACEKNKIPFCFGSDSPVVVPDLKKQIEALNLVSRKSQKNKLSKPDLQYFSHPETNWVQGQTFFSKTSMNVEKVIFDGNVIFEK